MPGAKKEPFSGETGQSQRIALQRSGKSFPRRIASEPCKCSVDSSLSSFSHRQAARRSIMKTAEKSAVADQLLPPRCPRRPVE